MSGAPAVYAILVFALTTLTMSACKAKKPSTAEEKLASEAKQQVVGGKDWQNPTADNEQSVKLGAKHFHLSDLPRLGRTEYTSPFCR